MRLIDADKLLEAIANSGAVWETNDCIDVIEILTVKKIVDDAPTIKPKRKFIQIITTYYPDDIICYDEYKGKPYFSIAYQENGEVRVGYGTYNPDVLSGYLRDYFFNEEGEK